jgi:hypothetical protein
MSSLGKQVLLLCYGTSLELDCPKRAYLLPESGINVVMQQSAHLKISTLFPVQSPCIRYDAYHNDKLFLSVMNHIL